MNVIVGKFMAHDNKAQAERLMGIQIEGASRIRPRRRALTRRWVAGFTLIELMMAIAILAIIVGVAIPSYNQYVRESSRAEAKGILLQASQTLERCFTRYSAYNAGDCPLGNGATQMSENDKYELTVASTATTFDLTAAPKGSQTEDTDCGSFTLDETGRRGAKGGFVASDIEECW